MPAADIRSGGDRQRPHRRGAAAERSSAFLRGRGLAVNDLGTDTAEPVDYPDVAAPWRDAVARGEADAGIVIDGAGIGSAIAANKVNGIRAAMATTETIARYSREHNGANVLTLGATLVTPRRRAGHRDDVADDADARAAIHPAAGEDRGDRSARQQAADDVTETSCSG